MSALVDELPSPHLTYFVDTVSELIAAVLDVHSSLCVGQIAAVDESDAGQFRLRLIDAEGFELAVKRRAFHADKLRRARNIAAEAADLRHEIFALEGFARLAERQAHQMLAAAESVRHARYERGDFLRQHACGHRRFRHAAR